MSSAEPRVLKGFRDYLPAKMVPRQKMLRAIERTFERFGFLPLMTPALEHLDILTGKYGDEGESLMYRFRDQGGRDVALRYDLTVPLARVVAQYPELGLPFRRYQIAPVWRAEKPARGRFREFVQCDGDIVGSSDMAADAEVVCLAAELLSDLGVREFVIRLNNRNVLSGLAAKLGVTDAGKEATILRTIDKLPKIGEDETKRLLEESGLEARQAARALEFVGLRGETAEVLAGLRRFFDGDERGLRGTAELEEVFSIVRAAGLGERAELDLSIARGLNYYTGTIYEAFLGGLPGFGAVIGGGRYDSLIGIFRGEEIPGVGVSLGVDRLLEGLEELGLVEQVSSVAPVLVSVFGPEGAPYSARVAAKLRAAGIACALYPAYHKLGKQFRYAERSRFRWAVVAGPDEEARAEVSVKDLSTGRQESVGLDRLEEYLAARISAGPGT
ncbi:MAG: histidine--tRNA ligase [Planctomycetota bacterium]